MKRTVRLPIFRTFTHPKLEAIGVKDGAATSADLAEMAANTNALISKKLHVPPMRQTHRGTNDGEARGWLTGVAVEGTTLMADLSFTEAARAKVKGGELRWFSAGIRRDFSLTGEPNGPKLPGLYVDHVALLGDEHPQVKGLVDLSTVDLSESDALTSSHVYFSLNESGEFAYFAEGQIEQSTETGEPTMTIEELQKQLDAEKAARAAAEKKAAQLEADQKKATANAAFSEHVKAVKALVAGAVTAKKLGAEGAERATAIGVAMFQGDTQALSADFAETLSAEQVSLDTRAPIALFGDLIKSLGAIVPTERLGAGDPEDVSGSITAADFSDSSKGERIEKAFFAARKKNPALSFTSFRASFHG